MSVCADWNGNTHSHSWLFPFYFKSSYRLKSEWQRNIPQSDSLLIAQTFLHFLFQTLLAPPSHTDPTANQSEGQSPRGPIRAQEAGFQRGVREIRPVCFDRCCTINTNSLTPQPQRGKPAANEESWPSVTQNNPEEMLSIHPRMQKSPLKHFHSYTRHNNGRKPSFYQRTGSFRNWWMNEWGKKTHDVHDRLVN